MCDTLLCPTHKGSGTKDDPIDLTEDTDKEDNDLDDVDSGRKVMMIAMVTEIVK